MDERTASLLEADARGPMAEVTPFTTSNYDAVLAAEIVIRGTEDSFVLVCAATGDEAAYLLSSNDDDEPSSADTSITWRERRHSREHREPALPLRSGDILGLM